MTSRRVGILGGMFDPIHNGHLDVIAAAHAALQLDEIFVVPANVPPHRAAPVASSYHRFAMVALAIAGREECRATDLELREAGPSYTSDTLRRFQSQGFDPADLFFIIGADAFLEIATWKNYPALLELSHFAVISRSGVSVGELPVRLPSLASRMRREFDRDILAVDLFDQRTDCRRVIHCNPSCSCQRRVNHRHGPVPGSATH